MKSIKNSIQNKFLIIASFCFVFSFMSISCAKKNQVKNEKREKNLREQTNDLLESFSWSDELEPERITKKINRYENISEKVKLTPLSIINNVDVPNEEESIVKTDDFSFLENGDIDDKRYIAPFIDGFGYLDISNIPKDLLEIVKKFCISLEINEDVDNYMATDCIYSLGLFYLNLKNIQFDKKDAKLDTHLIGSAFINGTTYEIPVRFFCDDKKKNFIDINLFFIKDSSVWKVDQIQIVKFSTN